MVLKLIKVSVFEGLFPSERLIILDGEDVSFFVHQEQLECNSYLKVALLDEDDHHALVQVFTQSDIRIVKISKVNFPWQTPS